jgi:hypothetical protein
MARSAPLAAQQWLDRMTPAIDMQLADNVCRRRRFVFRREFDVKLLLGLQPRADQHKFGSLEIQQADVFGRKSPAAKLALAGLRIMRFLIIA